MPRRRVVAKRKILPDPKFQDRLVTKFVNDLMRKGNKSIAERVCYGAFSVIEERAKEDPLKTFKKALDNVKPVLEMSRLVEVNRAYTSVSNMLSRLDEMKRSAISRLADVSAS